MRLLPFFLFAIVFFQSSSLFSQELPATNKDFRRLHYLSEEEMYQTVKNPDFTETPPPPGPVRMVGEFEPQQAVLIRYTFGIPYSLIREMAEDIEVVTIVANTSQANTVRNLYVANNVDTANCSFLIAPSDSYWTRDYGPWFIFDGANQPGIVDFPYNRPRPNDDNVPVKVAQMLDINLFGMNVEHTGGNMMADGHGMAASTELVYEENGNQVTQVNTKMLNYLGIERYDVMNDPLGDYIKHIDCWGKYLAPDKILLGQVPASDPRYSDYEAIAAYFASTPSAYGYPYKVYRVFSPGGSPATPYTNSLIINHKVFVPLTGNQYDDEAIAVYQQAMPGYEIIGVTYSGWLDTDALHCRTHEIADIGMLFLDHRPLYGQLDWQDSVMVQANIIPYSGAALLPDSLRLFYSINGGDYQQSALVQGIGNQFQAWIKNYGGEDTIRYFLAAADASGRSIRHPYMAQLDPHIFVTGEMAATQLTFSPDTVFFTNEIYATLCISNPTPNTVVVDDIFSGTLVGLVNPAALPATINPGANACFEVMLNVVMQNVFDRTFVEDSLTIISSLGQLHVPVMINFDLISATQELGPAPANVSPNPFVEKVMFQWQSAQDGWCELKIYDVAGEEVSKLGIESIGGMQQLIWDGRNKDGRQMPEGVYYYRLSCNKQTQSGKLVRIKQQ